MRHLPVFLNLLSLILGIACLAKLSMSYAMKRDAQRLSRLAFFASYSYLMIAAFVFSYYLINVGSGLRAQRAFAGLIFSGMAAIEITFPWMLAPVPASGRKWSPALPAIIAAIVTAAQAGAIWLIPDRLSFLPLTLAFLPFSLIIALALAKARKSGAISGFARGDILFSLLYIPVLGLAAWEVSFLYQDDFPGAYALLSLPLAYALTSMQFLRSSAMPRPQAETLYELPASLIERRRLTAREAEMARFILTGKENKEIADALSLSENTVRNHIYNLYQKLGIQRRMDLIRLIREENPSAGS